MRDTTALSVSVWIWVRLTSLISSYLTFGALSWGILSNQRSGRGWTGHPLSCGGTSLGDLALVVSTFRLALCNYTLLMSLGTYAKRISLGYNEVLIVLWLWFYYRRRIQHQLCWLLITDSLSTAPSDQINHFYMWLPRDPELWEELVPACDSFSVLFGNFSLSGAGEC